MLRMDTLRCHKGMLLAEEQLHTVGHAAVLQGGIVRMDWGLGVQTAQHHVPLELLPHKPGMGKYKELYPASWVQSAAVRVVHFALYCSPLVQAGSVHLAVLSSSCAAGRTCRRSTSK